MKGRRSKHVTVQPERRSYPTDGRLPTLAAITMVRDEAVMLPRWIEHYSRQCGAGALYVLDDNSSDGSTDDLPCSVIRLPVLEDRKFEPSRIGVVSGVAAALLNVYDAVVFADADEFVVADPKKYADLRHFLADRPDSDVLGAMTLNVFQDLENEGPLDPERPVLEQRRLAKFIPLMCKPAVKRVPAAWAAASHGIMAPFQIDPDLYMFHLKFADRDGLRRAAEHRQRMVALDNRAATTSWRHGGDHMVEVLERLNENIDRDAIRRFRPPRRKLEAAVRAKGSVYRTRGKGQVAAMETHQVMRIPERFRGVL